MGLGLKGLGFRLRGYFIHEDKGDYKGDVKVTFQVSTGVPSWGRVEDLSRVLDGFKCV